MATRAGAPAAGFVAKPNSKNYYKRLGMNEKATSDQIRRAYKKSEGDINAGNDMGKQ